MTKKLREIIKRQGKGKGKSRAGAVLEKLQGSVEPLVLDELYISEDGSRYQRLDEGRKWVDGRFSRNIGIDPPTSGRGQRHAHVFGRKGNEVVVINVDGTASHQAKGKLHDKDAQALEDQGFSVPADRIVEWWAIGETCELLLE